MRDTRPHYAPGDRVLVEGEVKGRLEPRDGRVLRVVLAGWLPVLLRPSHMRPVASVPDPRDTAIAAARALADHWEQSLKDYPGQLPGTDRLYRNHAANLRRCLDGLVPAPAPPAPTSSGWMAEELTRHLINGGIDVAYDGSWVGCMGCEWRAVRVPAFADAASLYAAHLAAVITLRVEKAAAADPLPPIPRLETP